MLNPFSELNRKPVSAALMISDKEFFEIFQSVLEKWAFLPSANIGPAEEGAANLTLERMVHLSGPMEGTLVVRSSEAFGQYLWENVDGGQDSPQEGALADVFTEFVNLFCGHVLTVLRPMTQSPFNSFLPKPSEPSLWPQSKPQQALAVLVEDIPVEIRLWIHTSSLKDAQAGRDA